MSRPWMKFYPADWRSDPALRRCSMAARGLWMEMLCIMHEAEPYGHLVIKGVPVDDVTLAKLAGIGLKECRKSLASLRELGVYSVSEQGNIFSRRMEADHAKALKDKEHGKKGGNPDLIGGVNPGVKAQKPEARDQKEPTVDTSELNPEKTESDNAAGASRSAGKGRGRTKSYAFEAGVIRLNAIDLEAWRKRYLHLFLESELAALAAWAGQPENRSNWFFAVQGALAKRNRDQALAKEVAIAEAQARAVAPAKQTFWTP